MRGFFFSRIHFPMPRPLLSAPALSALLFATASAHANTACAAALPATLPATLPAGALSDSPFATLERFYKPLLPFNTEDAWALKVATAAKSEEKFLTSSRDLFYLWAKDTCSDWLADPGAYVTCHGDVHLGNLGTYVADLPTARLAIGLKDFDESAIMPFQTDLLQAATSLRVTAAADGHPLDETLAARAVDELLAAYRSTLRSGQSATEALRKDPYFSTLLKNNDGPLRNSVDRFFTPDDIRPVLKNKKGEIKERLLPAIKSDVNPNGVYTREVLCAALSESRAESTMLVRLLLPKTSDDFDLAIVSAALRYRVNSGGSQGQPKLLIHLAKAMKTFGGAPTDIVLYLKGQSEPAASRTGYIPPTRLPGGLRNVRAALGLCSPEPDALGSITILDQSYVVSIYNPWEEEPTLELSSDDEVLEAARIFGTVLAAAHRNTTADKGDAILSRVTPKLREQLLYRSAADERRNHAAFAAFAADPALPALRQRAESFLAK